MELLSLPPLLAWLPFYFNPIISPLLALGLYSTFHEIMVPFRIHWATSHIEKELSALHTEEAAAKGRIGQENAARAIKGKSEKVRGAEKVVHSPESVCLVWSTVSA